MDQLIFKYMAGNGSLCLPGIGRFTLEQEAAEPDITEQKMRPPKTVTRFSGETVQEDHLLTQYVSRHYVLHEAEARKKIQQYIQQLIDEVKEKGKANLSSLGILEKQSGEGYTFAPNTFASYLQLVDAVRSIRQDDVHMIRVGEEQKTNVEMAGLLSETPRREWKWWIIPLIAGVLALAYILYHLFIQQGPLGSQQKIHVQ